MKRIALLLICMTIVFSSISNIYAITPDSQTAAPIFTDVRGHWAESEISELAKQGIIHGVGNSKFEPEAYMTRCQFASLLHSALDLQIKYFRSCDINEIYSDVKNDTWYAGQLYDLVTTGIVDDSMNFRPDGLITREEIAHLIVNAYEYNIGRHILYEGTELDKFKDKGDISPLFLEDSLKVVKLKLMTGKSNDLLKPRDYCKRAEVAIVIGRFLKTIKADGL